MKKIKIYENGKLKEETDKPLRKKIKLSELPIEERKRYLKN